MNTKHSEVEINKYDERIRMRSIDKNMVCTQEQSTHYDDLMCDYTSPALKASVVKNTRIDKNFKDSDHRNLSDTRHSDSNTVTRAKMSQGRCQLSGSNDLALAEKVSTPERREIKTLPCTEIVDLLNSSQKRKRPSDNDLLPKRSRRSGIIDSSGSPINLDSILFDERYTQSYPQRVQLVSDYVPPYAGDCPDSLSKGHYRRACEPASLQARATTPSKGFTKNLYDSESKPSTLNPKMAAHMYAEPLTNVNRQFRTSSPTNSSLGGSGDATESPPNVSHTRHPPATVDKDDHVTSAKFNGDDIAWKSQGPMKPRSDAYKNPTVLNPTNMKPLDNSGAYVPGMDLLLDGSDVAPIELISRFSKTPVSSPEQFNDSSSRGLLLDDPSVSQLPNQMDSNIAQRPASSAHTSPVTAHSAGMELNKAAKVRYAQLRQQRKRMEPTERQPLPALHLHLSKDGTSPLPPGWQRAPNVKRNSATANTSTKGTREPGATDGEEVKSSDMYAYYYYHVRTRQTRWDPPVYPWDADPFDNLTGETGEDDPEAPYNWGCASKYSVTHEEIEAMYGRLRQRILERQCTELLHDMAGKTDAPQGAGEQGFAIELFTLVHNVLRTFRDARCKVGRIVNDEDLYYLTKKLAQAVILKEVQRLHQAQAASSSSLFAAPPPPELTPNVQSRVTAYVKRYMESKGSFYRRREQQHQLHSTSHPHHHQQQQQQQQTRSHHRHHHHPQHSGSHSRQGPQTTTLVPTQSKPDPSQGRGSRSAWHSTTGLIVDSSPKALPKLTGFESRP